MSSSGFDYPYKLVRVLFGPAIPTSSFNFQFFFILVTVPFLLLTGHATNDLYVVSAIIPPRMVCPFNYLNSLSMVKTTVIRLNLNVFFLFLHLVLVYDVLSYIYNVCE